jgi:hypothetical protein
MKGEDNLGDLNVYERVVLQDVLGRADTLFSF